MSDCWKIKCKGCKKTLMECACEGQKTIRYQYCADCLLKK